MSEVTTDSSRPKSVRRKTKPNPDVVTTVPATESISATTGENPTSAVLALQRHILDPAHLPMYATRRQQLQSAMTALENLARKIPRSDDAQQAALSALYELLLIVTERFSLLLNGVTQLSAMNRATSLSGIRDARNRYRHTFDAHQAARNQIDAPMILRLLAELSRQSI
jgi:hypothetical protein